MSFEIRISSFTPCQFYGEEIAGACPDFQMEILSVTVILARSHLSALHGSIDSFILSGSAVPFSA